MTPRQPNAHRLAYSPCALASAQSNAAKSTVPAAPPQTHEEGVCIEQSCFHEALLTQHRLYSVQAC